MDMYRVTVETTIKKYSYGQLDSTRVYETTFRLDEYKGLKALIVNDSILVGVMVEGLLSTEKACLPGKCVTTYYASDDDGTGSTYATDECRLVCVSYNNKENVFLYSLKQHQHKLYTDICCNGIGRCLFVHKVQEKRLFGIECRHSVIHSLF